MQRTSGGVSLRCFEASRGPFIDVALVVMAAVVLGLTVGWLLTNVATGLAITLGTAAAFRFVLGTLTT
ncbi:hypothetical protein [Rhodococcus qingshengii]|uniref:hypothetical protein n=1 Tax=Rhodococcus qingshengii TaxID=334542 RepID=UPI0022366A4F|nr:hypothetical protein [Rhodococcus qingshengii]